MAELTAEDKAILAEAERRGIQLTPQVSPEDQAILDEAQRRGISLEPPQPKGKIMAVDMPPFGGGKPQNQPSGAGRSFDKGPYRTIGAAMGGTGGAIAGTVAGTPVAGTMIGAALGEGAGQMWEQGQYPPTMVGGTIVPGSMGSVDIDPYSAMNEGSVQGVMDVTGTKAAKALVKPFGWATGKVKPGAKRLQEIFKRKYGGELTHADMTKSYLGDTAQNIAESGAFSGQVMRNLHEAKQAIPLQNGFRELGEEIATGKYTMDEAGDFLLSGILGDNKAKRAAIGKSWQKMDEALGQPLVNVDETVKMLDDIIAKAPSGGSEAGRRAKLMLDKIRPKGQPPGPITWEMAHIEQSDLFDIPTATKQAMSNRDDSLMKQMRGSLLKAMHVSAKNAGPEAYEMWKTIRKQYGAMMQPYTSPFIKQILRTEGGKNIANKIFRQQSAGVIKKLKSVVPVKDWKNLQAAWLEEEAATAINKEGIFDLRGFLNKINNMKAYDAIFDGDVKGRLDDLIGVVRLIGEEGSAGKSGSIFIQMKQAGAVSNLAGGAAMGTLTGVGSGSIIGGVSTAGLWLGGPWVIAKILANPKATRFFTAELKKGGTGEMLAKALEVVSRFGARETGSIAKDYMEGEQMTPPSMNIP